MDEASRRHFFKRAGSLAGLSVLGARGVSSQPTAAGKPRLTLACSDYLRFTPLATGDLRAKDVEQTDLAMGRDFHGHGLSRNRHALDVFCASAFEDGLTRRRVKVEDYFADFLKHA